MPVTNYEDIVPLLQMQNPDMKVVGTIWSPQQRASEVGAARIRAIGESLGLQVVDETIVVTPDLYQAVQKLADQGAEAIIIPIFTFQGFQLLLSLSYDYGLPVIFSAPQNAYRGGTIGGGFFGLYKQGAIAANMLIAYLNGDLDIAKTAIYEGDDFAYAINLDAASLQDVDIPQAMLDGAAYVVEDGETAQGVTKQFPEVEITLPEMSLEERRAAEMQHSVRASRGLALFCSLPCLTLLRRKGPGDGVGLVPGVTQAFPRVRLCVAKLSILHYAYTSIPVAKLTQVQRKDEKR